MYKNTYMSVHDDHSWSLIGYLLQWCNKFHIFILIWWFASHVPINFWFIVKLLIILESKSINDTIAHKVTVFWYRISSRPLSPATKAQVSTSGVYNHIITHHICSYWPTHYHPHPFYFVLLKFKDLVAKQHPTASTCTRLSTERHSQMR